MTITKREPQGQLLAPQFQSPQPATGAGGAGGVGGAGTCASGGSGATCCSGGRGTTFGAASEAFGSLGSFGRLGSGATAGNGAGTGSELALGLGRGREFRRRRRKKSRNLLRLQAEKGGMQGRRERDNRRRTYDQPYRESLRQPVRHRIPPRENSLDPFFRLSGFGHRDAVPPHAFRRFELREKAEQGFGVTCAIGASGQRGFVACLLREIRQMAFEPPRQGTEPKDRAVNQRQPLPQRVAPLDVRKLVRQHSCEFLVVPSGPAGGQQDRGFAHTHH